MLVYVKKAETNSDYWYRNYIGRAFRYIRLNTKDKEYVVSFKDDFAYISIYDGEIVCITPDRNALVGEYILITKSSDQGYYKEGDILKVVSLGSFGDAQSKIHFLTAINMKSEDGAYIAVRHEDYKVIFEPEI